VWKSTIKVIATSGTSPVELVDLVMDVLGILLVSALNMDIFIPDMDMLLISKDAAFESCSSLIVALAYDMCYNHPY
jgi:hypothetical protein